ncbi:DUF2933 domain-containing protein [Alkalimarinus sediminis]|uniref:DUF2933 domain-containing protein n=1 Tax=Alkalimarinus sediminis TaxID=1632866 RepID=A0A9E8KRE8_9ALTE|nr:DUF2933 domain-containing protein [Alkalimarinus sediminis]UZW76280.1 DUF2933 domain-containing protein [Alkalimarinus sediminis]
MSSKPSFWFTPKGVAALGLIGATSYFLLMEHRPHLFTILPFLIFLLCPLMHIFMHGGHGGHGGHEAKDHTRSIDRVDRDDYLRGYEDALKDKKEKRTDKDDNNAR